MQSPSVPKSSVPQRVRLAVWRNYCGATFKGRCFCCHRVIDFEDWHCGHVVAFKNGGKPTLSNLRPVCKSCNLEMRTMNMMVFIEKRHLEQPVIRIDLLEDEDLMEIDMM